MAAQRLGAAVLDGPHHLALLGAQGVGLAIGRPVGPEDLRYLQARPLARCNLRRSNRHRVLLAGLFVLGVEVQWAGNLGHLQGRNLGVADRGFDACMAQELLDDANVGAGFQQEGGKAVAQRVRRGSFAQAASLYRPGQRPGHGLGRHWTIPSGVASWKEIIPARSCGPPVGFQGRKQAGTEHDVTIFAAFALANMQEHALTIDVFGLEVTGLGNTQACTEGDHQDGAVFDVGDVSQKELNLVETEDIGELARHLGPRQCLSQLGLVAGDGVEKLEGSDVEVMACRRELAFTDDVEKELLYLALTELIRGATIVLGQMLDAAQILLLGGLG